MKRTKTEHTTCREERRAEPGKAQPRPHRPQSWALHCDCRCALEQGREDSLQAQLTLRRTTVSELPAQPSHHRNGCQLKPGIQYQNKEVLAAPQVMTAKRQRGKESEYVRLTSRPRLKLSPSPPEAHVISHSDAHSIPQLGSHLGWVMGAWEVLSPLSCVTYLGEETEERKLRKRCS